MLWPRKFQSQHTSGAFKMHRSSEAQDNVILRINNLNKSFQALHVTRQVTFDLLSGECVGLIGPNGAGKSTLLGLLSGSLRPDSGTLTLDGANVTPFAQFKRVRSGIAKASQIPQTFDRLLVFDNVRVAALYGAGIREKEATDWTADVLSQCGLGDKARRETRTLGLLDRKRLELAKAVAARPRVLLLDEVAAGLTEPEILEIVKLVERLKPGRATVWVEHIPYALRDVCERLILMDAGAKLLDGPFHTVWQDPKLHQIYMGVPDGTTFDV